MLLLLKLFPKNSCAHENCCRDSALPSCYQPWHFWGVGNKFEFAREAPVKLDSWSCRLVWTADVNFLWSKRAIRNGVALPEQPLHGLALRGQRLRHEYGRFISKTGLTFHEKGRRWQRLASYHDKSRRTWHCTIVIVSGWCLLNFSTWQCMQFPTWQRNHNGPTIAS